MTLLLRPYGASLGASTAPLSLQTLHPCYRTMATRTSPRICATINQRVYDKLVDLSMQQGRSISNLVAYLLEAALERAIAGETE